MVQFCGDCNTVGGLHIEPDTSTRIEQDYWEEAAGVQNAILVAEPTVAVKQSNGQNHNKDNKKPSSVSNKVNPQYPTLDNVEINEGTKVHSNNNNGSLVPVPIENVDTSEYESKKIDETNETDIRERSNAGVNYKNSNNNNNNDSNVSIPVYYGKEKYSLREDPDEGAKQEKQLQYCFCFCCRTATPCSVWIFIGCSFIFFKMGAIVTGRWIYLWQSSYDEVAFYVAFSVNLGFATFYFRHGSKHHNPFDILCLVITASILWGLLTFTTILYKKDMFFYIATVFYCVLISPYIGIGSFITYKFWKSGKLFAKRVEGNTELEPLCRKLFFAHNLMIFDTQAIISASIVSMAPSLNPANSYVWVSPLIVSPIYIAAAISWLTIGYFAIRRENRILTWIFSVMCINPFTLVICMLWKMPTANCVIETFRNVIVILALFGMLLIHTSLITFLWLKIVPSYGKGLRPALIRTNENGCIQCAEITICR